MINQLLDDYLNLVKDNEQIRVGELYDKLKINYSNEDVVKADEFLHKDEYVNLKHDGSHLTGKGAIKLHEGGFMGSESKKQIDRDIIFTTMRYAKWSLIVSVISILLTIVLTILPNPFNKSEKLNPAPDTSHIEPHFNQK